MSNAYYMIIPMRVYDVNIDSSFHTYGLPSLSGVDGFCHALTRNMHQYFDESYMHEAFSYIINNIEYAASKKRYSASEFGDKGKVTPSMSDDKLALLNQTIIIKFNSDKPISAFYENDALTRTFETLRFMSGHTDIQTPCQGNKRYAVQIIDAKSDGFLSALKLCKRSSFIIEDANEFLESDLLEGQSRWDKYLSLISRPAHDDIGGLKHSRPEGLYIPVHVGYSLLEVPKKRALTRCPNTEHSFAETVLGVARCRTIASAKINYEKGKFMWTNSALHENKYKENLFIVYGVYI